MPGVAKKLVVGNWKMNGSLAGNASLLGGIAASNIPGVERAVCVPYPYLAQARAALEGCGVALGAQNLSEFAAGAYTGEVSGGMLAEFGCSYVLVGHSERRALFAETSVTVGRKARAALDAGLVPVVCVGETEPERVAGREMEVVGQQLDALLAAVDGALLGRLVIAYEPVWAIGSGLSASVEQVRVMHAGIRRWLRGNCESGGGRILYGGSVKPGNTADLFSIPDVDGGLVGGASLVADEFSAICRAATGV